MVIHTPTEAGPLALTLAPAAGAYLESKPGGAVQVTRPVTAYGDDGTAHTILSPEYVVHAPVAHDAADATGDPTATTPVSLTLGATPSGVQALLLTVDSAWLRDARRAYPVTLDLPLATAYSAVHSGLAATVNSCAPDAPAAHAGLVVGTMGGCAYHGLVSFNTTPLLADTPIVSATLRLYSPDQTGPTGIRIYPNTPLTSTLPVWEPSPYLQPTWASAPAVVTGSVGLAQSASDGRWQSWDVTDLVRGWVRRPATNGGLTLESDGMPVRLASPLRAGRDAPALAPYLDIVYGSRPAIVPAYAPSSTTAHRVDASPNIIPCCGGTAPQIYGVAGTFAAPCNQRQCGNALAVDQAAGLGAQYIRVGVTLQCNREQPSRQNWWDTHNLYNIKPASAAPYSPSGIYEILTNAYNDGLTPIINIRQDDGCASYLSLPRRWSAQVYDFISTMPSSLLSQVRAHTTYFEIANEINNDGPYGNGVRINNKLFLYTGIFMAAAEG